MISFVYSDGGRSKHLTCVKDRVLYDTYDCSRDGTRCVYGYWSKE